MLRLPLQSKFCESVAMERWMLPVLSLDLLFCQMNTKVLIIFCILGIYGLIIFGINSYYAFGSTLGIWNSVPYIAG